MCPQAGSVSGKVNGAFSGAKKAKRHASRIKYYPNSVATYQLLMSAGDIASNFGPVPYTSKNKRMSNRNIFAAICSSYEKPVRKNQKRVLCEVCVPLTHAHCSGIASCNIKQFSPCQHITNMDRGPVFNILTAFPHML